MHHGENTGAGHRTRMRDKFLCQGEAPFLPHELLEILLYTPIPYRDTNPTAHRLMDRFGSLEGVLAASAEELCEVEGVGANVAAFLAAFRELGRRALYAPETPAPRYTDFRSLGEYLVQEERQVNPATTLKVLFFNNRFDILADLATEAPLITSPAFSLGRLARTALQYNATMCVLVSDHGGRSAFPTGEEVDVTVDVRSGLKTLGVTLLEHYILSGTHYVGVSQKIINGFEDPGVRFFFRDEAVGEEAANES